MKTLTLVLYTAVMGNAPFCAYDGYNYQCFYYSWASCEQAISYNPAARCVPRP